MADGVVVQTRGARLLGSVGEFLYGALFLREKSRSRLVEKSRSRPGPPRRPAGPARPGPPRCLQDGRGAHTMPMCTLTDWWLEKRTDRSCNDVPVMIVIRILLWLLAPTRGARSSQHSTLNTPFSSQRALISGHRVPCTSIQRVRVHGVIASTSSRACKFPPRPHRTSLVVSAEIRFLACLPTRREPGTSDRPRGRPRGSVKSAEFLPGSACRNSHRPR